MRPASPVLFTSIDPLTGDSVEIMETGSFAVCLVADGRITPIGIRLTSSRPSPRYPQTGHAHPGHNVNLADRLNARFEFEPGVTRQWFACYEMQPARMIEGEDRRKGGETSKTKRRTNQVRP